MVELDLKKIPKNTKKKKMSFLIESNILKKIVFCECSGVQNTTTH